MRFHSKYHNKNHHTEPTAGYPDSASDPIASSESPFKGDFVIDGSIIAETAVFSQKLLNLEVDDITINNNISDLGITNNLIVDGVIYGDGSGITGISADSIGNYDASSFQLISEKDQNDGYVGIDSTGSIARNIDSANISNLVGLLYINGESSSDILMTSDLSSSVAPLIDDGLGGKVLPVDYLPDHNHDSDYAPLNHNHDIGDLNVIDDDTMVTASDTTLATSESIKAYVDANSGGGGASLTQNGYQILPSGLIMQWGSLTPSAIETTVTLPYTFPTTCLNVQTTIGEAFSDSPYIDNSLIWGGYPKSGEETQKITILSNLRVSEGGVTYRKIFWQAIGH